MSEIESCELIFSGETEAGRFPVEASGDHEVQDEPEVVIEADGDSFADAAEGADRLSFECSSGRGDGAEQEGAGEADFGERFAEDSLVERGQVGGYVREFRHGYQNSGRSPDSGDVAPDVSVWFKDFLL